MPFVLRGMVVLAVAVVPCALAAQQAPPRDTPRAAASGAATVSGRVVDKDTGEPLRRMTVVLTRRSPTGERPIEATTGPDGRYEITDLPPGRYIASVQPGEYRGGYRAATLGVDDSTPAFNRPPPLELKPGDVRRIVDFAMARSYAIEGRVLNEYGEPLAEVMVAADPLETAAAGYARMLRTDDRGAFRLYGLSPGRYAVCATAGEAPWSSRPPTDDPQQTRYIRTCHPSATTAAAAAPVVIRAADVTGVTIQMQRGRTYAIAGVVYSGSGTPAENASLNIEYTDRQYPRGYVGSVEYKSGSFVARGVPPGEYLVRVNVMEPGPPTGPSSVREHGFARVTVDAADVTDVVVRTSAGASASGRVVFDGEPPPGRPRLTVSAGRHVDSDPLFNNIFTPAAAVNDDRAFELTRLHGPVVIGLIGLPPGWIVKTVRHGDADITQLPVQFKAGDSRPLEIVATNHVARLTVRPLDEKGQPAPTALILLIPGDARRSSGFTLPSEAAAPDGTATFLALRPGDYLLAAIAPEQGREVLRRRKELTAAVRERAQRITLEPDQHPTVDVRLITLPEARAR